MKRWYLVFAIAFAACAKEANEQNRFSITDNTITKTEVSRPSVEGEYEEAFPGYEKEWVKYEGGFEFQRIIGIPDTYILDGDALINEKGIQRLIRSTIETKGAVHKNPFNYWIKGIVYYKYDSSATTDYITKVEAAISDIEDCCGVQFYPATSSTTNLINFVKSSASVGNNSYVGCIGGTQDVNIYNYQTHGIILHEILHALGFYHEHGRQDRDSYITINWSNIRPEMQFAFNKYTINQGYDISVFDDNSLMMYSSYISDPAFVYDSSVPVMYWNDDPTRVFGGQRVALSEGDIKALTSIYGSPYSMVKRIATPIQHTNETINGNNYVTVIDSVNVSLRFFLERWNATPTHIQYPRSVVLLKTYVTLDQNGSLNRSTFTTNYYASPGDSVCIVDSFVYRKSTLNGQITDYYDIEYSLR